MRRAAIQNLRVLRRPTPRKTAKGIRVTGPGNVSFQRSISRTARPLQSSMQLRRLSFPVVVGLGAAGAYYAYNGATSSAPLTTQAYTATTPSAQIPVAGVASANVPDAVRKALIIDKGGLHTAELRADQRIEKETDASGRKLLEMVTPDQASAKLRTNEESYLVHRGSGVVRYDVVQLPSNDPIEDDHVEKIVEVPATTVGELDGKTTADWMFWGVFDGHAGWTTSAKLRQTLVAYVARELNETYKAAQDGKVLTGPTADSVDAAIRSGFLKLDHEIVNESVKKVMKAQSKSLAAEVLAPALSGSCALLSFYDSRSKELRVACTGDSRAVLGRRADNGKWTATALSIDQTGGTPSEDARLRAEHPNEPYVTHNGRILGGLEPSRAFGDAVYKWSKETQDKLKSQYFGRTPSKFLQTPPYVTAEPVISTTQVEPAKGDFVVMATDGLWEMLTNEEVVGLVGQWMEKHKPTPPPVGIPAAAPATTSDWLPSWLQSQKKQLPVENKAALAQGEGQRAPIRQQQWGVTSGQDERFVVEDNNAATHLVRNALGGKDRDMVAALLTLPSPFSRRYRDDLTVQVIFFGENEDTGKIELNANASATAHQAADAKAVKAKL